jgi:hypothetical protein
LIASAADAVASEMRHLRAMISVSTVGVLAGIKMAVDLWIRDKRREQRRKYYREDYLKFRQLETEASNHGERDEIDSVIKPSDFK